MIESIRSSFLLLTNRQRTIFVTLVVARMLVQILDAVGLAAVGMLGAMLASGLTGKDSATFLTFTLPIGSSATYLWVALLIAALFIFKSTMATVLLRVTTVFLAKVEATFSTKVAGYVFSGDLERLREFSKGEIQWAVAGSSSVAFSGLLYAASSLITEAALFISVFAVMVAADFSTALLLTLYFLILVSVFQLSVTGRLKRIGERNSLNSIGVNDTVLDLTNCFREISVVERQDYFLNRFSMFRERQALDSGLTRFLVGIPRFFVEAALIVGMVGLIAWQFAKGELSQGLPIVGIFATGGLRMMAALLPLQGAVNSIRTSAPLAQKAQEIIRRTRVSPSDNSQRSALEASTIQSFKEAHAPLGVSISKLSFSYRKAAEPVLSNLSLDIPAGHYAALVGPSGAGKTTFVDLLLGILSPSSGKIELGGVSPVAIRKLQPGRIAYVPQSPGLVSGTVAQNVALGIPDIEINREKVSRSLAKAELLSMVDKLPDGLDTSLDNHSNGLSGGQLQRLGIARALYLDPDLLVLDEATSALDAGTESSVSQTIEKLRGEVTLVVIAHRLSTIQNADVVFALDNGRLIGQGTFSAVRRKVPMVENFVQLMKIDD